jgi:hypothetical protein
MNADTPEESVAIGARATPAHVDDAATGTRRLAEMFDVWRSPSTGTMFACYRGDTPARHDVVGTPTLEDLREWMGAVADQHALTTLASGQHGWILRISSSRPNAPQPGTHCLPADVDPGGGGACAAAATEGGGQR